MNKVLALAADPSRLASLPAPVLPRQGLPRVVGAHPSRMLSSGPPPVGDFQGSSLSPHQPRGSTAIIDQLIHERALAQTMRRRWVDRAG